MHSLNDTTNHFLQADNFGYYQRFIHYLNERKALIIQIGQVDKTNDSQNITKNGTLQILYVNNLSLGTQLESLKA
ncbi:bacteriocin secretion accessory protein [Streptococcus pseudoporcinus]|uniref:Bacteriocin secretion accessory protein n=1 Tax=Streptococcus pseudoporcinus TaxID=361101 RepID=A0A4U9Z8N2_9STRE|nr:bacteriocin secretion accessory protein [Streptococcus pseudoporcinus]